MGLPGSYIGVGLVDPTTLSDEIYPSLATFYKPPVTQDTESGQPVTAPLVVVGTSHTNQRCRISPQILVRPQLQEHLSQTIQMQKADWTCSFDKYFDDIEYSWCVSIAGVMYEIRAIEHDGNKIYSRLLVSIIKPFTRA